MSNLKNLLAVVHRDGGQYATRVGVEQAILDGIQKLAQERSSYDDLQHECERLRVRAEAAEAKVKEIEEAHAYCHLNNEEL